MGNPACHLRRLLKGRKIADHRAVKHIIRPMLGFKSFRSATRILAGIEIMHMLKKGQLDCHDGQVASAADQFYSLAT